MSNDVFRIVMYDSLRPLLTRLREEGARAVEISGEALHFEFGWWSSQLELLRFPDFDLCDRSRLPLPRRYDLVFADQVLEHVLDPKEAVDNLRLLLRPGGYAVVTTVCLFPPHDRPADYWRFTPEGLRALFDGWDEVSVGSWGNADAARIALHWQRWNRDPGMREVALTAGNDPAFPVVVWATARRP